MNKRSIETESTVRGLITVEAVEDGRDIDVYVREALNCSVTGEAGIRVSPSAFYSLVAPILEEIGCTVHEPCGGV